jgi:hypothetical protein
LKVTLVVAPNGGEEGGVKWTQNLIGRDVNLLNDHKKYIFFNFH